MNVFRPALPCFHARVAFALALSVVASSSAQPVPSASAPTTPVPAVSTPATPPPTVPAVPQNTALIPVPQTPADGGGITTAQAKQFQTRHAADVAQAKKGGIDLLFVGDSIMQGWLDTGKTVWDSSYGKLQAAAFGVGYDRTQHVLWRLQNGEAEGFSPQVVELMIGTNNLGGRNTPDETIAGIKAVVQELRTRFPDAKVLLLGILPRGPVTDPVRKDVAYVNHALSQLNDLDHIFFLDLGPKFVAADGSIRPGLMKDAALLHPSAAGYQVWADATKNILPALLNSPAPGK